MSKKLTEDVGVTIGGMHFVPIPGQVYMHDYVESVRRIESKEEKWAEWQAVPVFRQLMLEDLWFWVYFVLKWPGANHPFVIRMCQEIDAGPDSRTLDVWAREHGKSTCITIAESMKIVCVEKVEHERDARIAIFSWSKQVAQAFLRSIKYVLETSEIVKQCFPDVFYNDPKAQAQKWSEDVGLFCRRDGFYKEATFEAHGLVEGMPTSKHFTHRFYDDIVTQDLVNSPHLLGKVKNSFALSHNLGTANGKHRVIGTPYHHGDLIVELMTYNKDGELLYHVRKEPATEGGEPNGKSVFLPETKLDELRLNLRNFRCQQLLDPTPKAEISLNPDHIREVARADMPQKMYKFMVIDPAGVRKDHKQGDSWAIFTIGVEPFLDELGASRVFILDMFVEEMSLVEATQQICSMYLRAGRILKLCVEKVAQTTFEVHIASAFKVKGVHISTENGKLHLLSPAGRQKTARIESALSWPLVNGKIHINRAIPRAYKTRLYQEMEQFPFAKHDDCLDSLSYLWDVLSDYSFWAATKARKATPKDVWALAEPEGAMKKASWMGV